MTTREDLIDAGTDHVMVLDHGLESLNAVRKALAMKKRVSIANKELMVVHGEEIVYLARERQAELIPLDSEHNAIFQCLRGEERSPISRLILTASGGPFRDTKWEDLENVTPKEVLKHPTWTMGPKTTVDSATLVNKAFEVIEAHHLFGIPYDRIEVRLHPESIVHAIVEFTDGSSKMLAYPPDMRFPLGYALFYPDRATKAGGMPFPSFPFDQPLHFEKIAKGMFPCFDLIMKIAQKKPETLRAIVENDQKAVTEFLQGRIPFLKILQGLYSLS
jgi:1-deoxy-D-xylulose-5-phosphate reductoisomerase